MVSEIHDVLKHNKNYMGDWRTLSSKLSHKLEDASTYAKNVIDIVCTRQLEECNSLRSNLSEISKYINRMFLNEKQVAKNYKLFAKVCHAFDHLFMKLSNIIVVNSDIMYFFLYRKWRTYRTN